jgi:hypothetical protein
MLTNRKLVAAVLIGTVAGLAGGPAYAHGFGERYDLPVPLSFFLVGAASTVALSFVVIGFFVQRREESYSYPRFNLLGLPWVGTVLASRLLLGPLKVAAVGLFALVVAAALFGTSAPIDNLAPTLVWVIWWVGTGYVSALLGNAWMVVNPWKIAFEWGEKLLGHGADHREAAMFRYPERWDVWPAVGLFFAFAWLENVYSGASQPFKLGLLIVLYSAITWAGMIAFGKHRWLKHGEAFSVLFGFFARFSPAEVKVSDSRLCRVCELDCGTSEEGCVDCHACFERAEPSQRELNIRPYGVGLAHPARVSTATAVFVVLALATVTFDGLTATPAWVDIQTAVYSAASVLGTNTVDTIDTAGLIVLPLVFLTVYLCFSWAIRQLSGETVPVQEVARAFVFSLVPIALAYNMAHFISLLLIQGQGIVPLASDPFGFGWDLFGTADYRLNIAIINAKIVWYLSVAAIVLGHIMSVYIAHVISIGRAPDHSSALRGQYPMLLLMVGYTATSLWIIAQPIVAEG